LIKLSIRLDQEKQGEIRDIIKSFEKKF